MYKSLKSDSNDGFTMSFTETTVANLENEIQDEMTVNGYKIKESANGYVIYERGSFVVRILLGAFYKYFKWEIRVYESNDTINVSLARKVSGMWGGLIGMNQNKKEIKRLIDAFTIL